MIFNRMSYLKTLHRAGGALIILGLGAAGGASADVFACYEGCTNSLTGSACVMNAATGDWHTTCGGGACPDAGSDVTVLSIHGGSIERHTSTLSAELAATFGWNRYDFSGHLTTAGCTALATDGNPNNNNHEVLHITSSNFNHGAALTLVGAHPNAVALHGCGGSCSDDTICIGGRNTAQGNSLLAYITTYRNLLPYNLFAAVGASASDPFCAAGIGGTATNNIVNRTSTNQGLQLEMSLDVRTALASGIIQDDLLRGLVFGGVARAMGELPTPLTLLDRVQTFTSGGKTYNRYFLSVENRGEYPQELFDAAPQLPPCGANANSSRTWVNIYDAADDSRIYGFCAFGSPANLGGIWFAREQGTAPAAVYVVLHDRQTGRDYKSNRIPIP